MSFSRSDDSQRRSRSRQVLPPFCAGSILSGIGAMVAQAVWGGEVEGSSPSYPTNFNQPQTMTISELKEIIKDLPDDMPVMSYENGDYTRRGDWNLADATHGCGIATSYGGYNGCWELSQKEGIQKSEFTKGEVFEALFIN